MAALDNKSISGSFSVNGTSWASIQILADSGNENIVKTVFITFADNNTGNIAGIAIGDVSVTSELAHLLEYKKGASPTVTRDTNWIIDDTVGIKLWIYNAASTANANYQVIMAEAK